MTTEKITTPPIPKKLSEETGVAVLSLPERGEVQIHPCPGFGAWMLLENDIEQVLRWTAPHAVITPEVIDKGRHPRANAFYYWAEPVCHEGNRDAVLLKQYVLFSRLSGQHRPAG